MTTDYLIVGAGAVGMAFADTLLSDTADRDDPPHIVIVDRYAAPGGHWNDAYPFVTLHQPSAFYGVASRELSRGTRDETGLNRGLADLATRDEILAYYDAVMRETFLTSGRLHYFPLCDYAGEGRFTHRLSGETFTCQAKTLVDATHLTVTIPKTHTPSFSVADGVRFHPPNDLPGLRTPADGYVVIGGGKTGIDACLWLIQNRVDPAKIIWIVSRDAWLLDRCHAQTHPDFFLDAMGAQAAQYEAIAQASDPQDMFHRLEAGGYFLRIDPEVEPEMFHAATVSRAEVDALRSIRDIVRLGKVRAVEPDRIVLDRGELPITAETVVVDASASALVNRERPRVFQPGKIVPQMIRAYQPAFSASLIAHIEARDPEASLADKNRLTPVAPLPDTLRNYMELTLENLKAGYLWGQDADIAAFMLANRLDGFSKPVAEFDRSDPAKVEVMTRLRAAIMPAIAKLNTFLETA